NLQVSKCSVVVKSSIEPKQLKDWLNKKEQLLLTKSHIKKLSTEKAKVLSRKLQYTTIYSNILKCKWSNKCLIGNIYETPLTFDMPNNMTVEKTSSRTVSICTTRHKKSNFTVVLSCMADDSFCSYLTDSVKNRFDEKNTNLAVIPGGLTSKLQLLD
ncbi:8682_t:CDS:2, partial [Diversispora eburnea]